MLTRCEYCECAVSGTRCENCGAPAKAPPAAQTMLGGGLSVIQFHAHDWRPLPDEAAYRCTDCGEYRTHMQMLAIGTH